MRGDMKQKLTKAAQIIGTVFKNWWKLCLLVVLVAVVAYGVLFVVGVSGVSIYTEKVQIVAPGAPHK